MRSATLRPRGERGPLASFGLHAGLLAASLVALFPPLWLLVTSFKPRSESFSAALVENFTVDNYTHVVADTYFLTWFGNSLLVVVGTTLIGVFIAATTGYAISRFRFPGMRPLIWVLLITQMFPMAVLIVPLYNTLARLGLLNQPVGLIITYLTVAVPFCAYLLKGYFDTIPVEIDEAGRVDGLSPFGTFWRLALPLARPGLAVTAFYTFLTAWGEVAYASKFMTSEDKYTLAFGMQTYVGQFKTEWGDLAAASILVTVPALVVFYVVQKYLVSGLTAGGTKG